MSNLDLGGIWDFAFDENNDQLPRQYTHCMCIPGCFDTTLPFAGKRGIGFYRRWIELESGINYKLVLQGVAHNAQIYLDGEMLAEHHGAFTSFDVNLPSRPGRRELVIAADNRFDGLNRPLHMSFFDWYSYGGIIRPVTLESWTTLRIDRITPHILDWRQGRVQVHVEYQLDSGADTLPEFEIYVDHNILHTEPIPADRNSAVIEIEIPKPKPWSPQKPHLHHLRIVAGDAEKEISVGLREIRTEGDRILLNDKPIRLLGVNRHDSTVQYGFALPPAQQLYDVQTLKHLGCNFVRTSHYPPDQRFIDLCDRHGLMVWCEATAWGYDEAMTTDPRTLEAQQQCITEMIRQYAHHPCIVCWGILNECASASPSARGVYETLIALVRKLDPTRPVTYASNVNPPAPTLEQAKITDLMFDLADWISLNVYPGWYEGGPEDGADRLENLAKRFEEKNYNKPILISEIGGGGIPDFEHYHPVKWSLAYQDQLLRNLLEYIRDRKLFNGVILWHFSDVLTSEDRWQRRPRQYNNKGLLDEFRKPKPAFETVRGIFQKPW